jgi:hypothetical protein
MFSKSVVRLMLGVLYFHLVIVPGVAMARVDQQTMDASTTKNDFNYVIRWRENQRSYPGPPQYPTYKEKWTVIAKVERAGGDNRQAGYRFMMGGEYWASMGMEMVGQSGVDLRAIAPYLIADRIGNEPMVIARYYPELAKLRIDVIKIQKSPANGGTYMVLLSQYTPHHGNTGMVYGYYRSDSEVLSRAIGYNPFEAFRGYDGDPVFHNINPGAAQVALSRAIAYHKSIIGLWIQTNSRVDQEVHTSGNIFQKKTTVTSRGYVTPSYYLAKPANMSYYYGSPSAPAMGTICVVNLPQCDDIHHVAVSGIYLEPLDGGSIKPVEELIYTQVDSQTGFTALFFTALVVLGTLVMAPEVIAAAETAAPLESVGQGAVAQGTGALTGVSEAATAPGFTPPTPITPGQLAGITGTSYAGLVEAAQGGSLVSQREDVFGAQPTVANISQVGPGSTTGSNCTQSFCQNFYMLALQKHQAAIVDMNNSNAGLQTTKQAVQGACDPTWSTAQCQAAGLTPGLMWRTDDYREANTAYNLKVREQACKAQGLTGLPLRQCIAPPLRNPNRPPPR